MSDPELRGRPEGATEEPVAPGRICPACHAAIEEINPEYGPWCDKCLWNLVPSSGSATKRKRQERRLAAEIRHEDAVLERALRERDNPIQRDFRARLAIWIAGLVHLATILLIAAAAWLFVEATRVPVIGVLGLLCLALAYAVRPRLGRIPKKAVVLTRDSHPRTFELLDHLGHDVGGPAFDRVALTGDINAGTSRVGVRRTRVLYLGVPLWICMDWNERTGLLGHELGHQVNGDVRRGFFLATSIQALRTWIDILTPRSRLHSSIQIVFRTVVRYPLRWVAKGLLASPLRLSSGRSRMGEYRADDIAAGLAGTDAVIRGLDKTLIASDCLNRSMRMCLYQPEADLWSEEKRFVADFPRRQRMRLRRINELSATSLYSTHPSVHRRMIYVAAQPTSLTGSPPGASLWTGVDVELAPLIQRIGTRICVQRRERATGQL